MGLAKVRDLADRLGALAGWRRLLAALALGAAGALAFAPTLLLPLLAVALTGFFWQAQGQSSRRRAFAIGWTWGFGHFAAGSYWIANSFLIEPERFGWMIPFAVGGLAAYLALYPALVAALLWRRRDFSARRILAFAALWSVGEWLRGHLLSGYPWNLVATVWDAAAPMLQSAALWGAWGLSFVTVLIFASPAALADDGARWAGRRLLLGGAVLLAALWIGGAWRLAATATGFWPDIRLRLVQAAIPQAEKMRGGDRAAQIAKHVALTLRPGFAAVTHVVWPESAANLLLDRDEAARRFIARAVPPRGALLTGALRAEPVQGPIQRLYNSLFVLDAGGAIRAGADKFHLVPLGEFVPLRRFLPFIAKLTPGAMDFSAGPGPRTIAVPGAPPAGILICYEVIFPGAAVEPGRRPDWLLTVTNDGWFGDSPGPWQHFAAARLRAVEEGLPLVRAANSGISGVVDPLGRVLARSSLGEEAVIDSPLPQPLRATLFARLGLLPFSLLAGGGLLAWALPRRSHDL